VVEAPVTVGGAVRGGARFRQFLGAVKKALAEKAAEAVEGIERAGGSSWQALAWLLERKYPELWSSSVADVKEIRRWIAQQEREKRKRGGGNAETAETGAGR
jgi:hypothetical protein